MESFWSGGYGHVLRGGDMAGRSEFVGLADVDEEGVGFGIRMRGYGFNLLSGVTWLDLGSDRGLTNLFVGVGFDGYLRGLGRLIR